jgi:DMSO reductase anchor subunit
VNPAPSVIVFTVLSGAGFGLMACLCLWPAAPGWPGFLHWALAYGLAVAGLVSSAFHLGRPERALRAFTQWRTSWLSREAWAAVLACLACAPVALGQIFGLAAVPGWPGAILCAGVILCTAMIYAQIRAVPRWHSGWTVAHFAAFAATGGLILVGHPAAPWAAVAAGVVLMGGWWNGDGAFARAGQTMGTATGLPGRLSVFEQPHTARNYIMREMIFRVGRTHARRLRAIAVIFAALAPAAILLASLSGPAVAVAFALHLTGALAARWLFFAEAEHVVGLFYGARVSA